jgi:hypothetical protein
MIQDLDESLRALLMSELQQIEGLPGIDSLTVTFDPPPSADADTGSRPRVNLYFYNVRENRALRDNNYHYTRRPGSEQKETDRQRGAIALDLSFLLTVHAPGGPTLEHRLLSEALGILMRHDSLPTACLMGALRQLTRNEVRLSVAQPDDTAHSDPMLLWQALGGRLRPAIGIIVTMPFNPFTPDRVRLVREVVMGIGPGIPPHGPLRPLDVTGQRVSIAGIITSMQSASAGQPGRKPLPEVLITLEGRPEQAMTDEKGIFYFLNLTPGEYTVVCRKRGMKEVRMQAAAPPRGYSDQLEAQTIVMEPLDPTDHRREETLYAEQIYNKLAVVETDRRYTMSLSGRLKYPDGRPAAYISVRVGDQLTITDAGGYYYFLSLPPGDHAVVAEAPGVWQYEQDPVA